MGYLESLIDRYIRIQIYSINARDVDYTSAFLKKELDKLSKYITTNKEIEDLYHKYKLGRDVAEMLNTDSYYHNLPFDTYPSLFKVVETKSKVKRKATTDSTNEINWDGFEMPPNYELITEQLPIVRKTFIKQSFRYIAFMELKKWVDTSGVGKVKTDTQENTQNFFIGKKVEPKNNFPAIFKNGFAYQLFMELKELTVQGDKLADYSFIFHKMKAKSLMAINNTVTEPKFIEFLKENFNADLSGKKLPLRNPSSKQQLYETTLNKYKAGIQG